MMRIALETSTSFGTVAVARDDRVLAEVGLGVQTRHAESALPALEYALEAAGVEREAVEEVVVGGGPGSFTGVRVAGATAKGLVAALDVPLRSFPSLLALAAGVGATGPVCALFDARRGEVYAGCWRVGGGVLEEVLAPMVGPVQEVLRAIGLAAAPSGPPPERPSAAPVFVGDGARRYRDDLERAGAAVMDAPAHPRASTLLWLAARDPGAGWVADVPAWEPAYIRASSAERGVRG